MLGIAVGCIGVPFNDFCRLAPDEFAHIYRAYSDEREAQYRDSWERMRLLAAITVQPYSKKKLTPRALLHYPWDTDAPAEPKPTKSERKAPAQTKEEAMARFREVLRKTGEGG